MKSILLATALLASSACFSQQETLGFLTYTPPAGWKKEVKQSSTIYSIVNNKTRGWCQIAVYKETASKGSIDLDFESEWATIVQPLGITAPSQVSDVQEFDGWKMKNGQGSFAFNGGNASTSFTVFSGYNICLSIIANTNTGDYQQNIQDFLSNLQLNKPADNPAPPANPVTTTPSQPVASTPAYKDNYAFNTTTFQDGWVSAVQPEWVEVTKANIKVLLHYAKEGTVFPADPAVLTTAAWNILVAPRYSNLQNFKTTYINYYNMPYIGMGYGTDNSTQQSVFIVLFRRSAGWIEVIAPDKNTFMQYFPFDPETTRWDSNIQPTDALDEMTGRNKFAVSAADLYGTGEWNSHYASNTFWTNYYTGASAGISTYSSSQWFTFGNNQSYTWNLVAANTSGGITNAAQAKGAGNFKSAGNWQLYFENIEGKPKTYDVYFTAIRGGRVLFMNDAKFPGSGVFTGYAKK
jgi:hypothetical protein